MISSISSLETDGNLDFKNPIASLTFSFGIFHVQEDHISYSSKDTNSLF